MANTTFLKTKIEPFVRDFLANKFGQPFRSAFLPHSGVKNKPASHEFDAVSEDRKTVCGIKSASWYTSGGTRGAGKIQGVYAELYFLSLVEANQKYLVLTDPEFFENFKRDAQGKLAPNIDLLYCELPEDLKREVAAIRTASRHELASGEQ
jgi:hypothetical protein